MTFVIAAVCLVLFILTAKGGQYYSSLKGCSDKLCAWLGFAFALIVLSASSVTCFIWGIIDLWRRWFFIVSAVCCVIVFLEFVQRVKLILVDDIQPTWTTIVFIIGVISLTYGLFWASLGYYGLI